MAGERKHRISTAQKCRILNWERSKPKQPSDTRPTWRALTMQIQLLHPGQETKRDSGSLCQKRTAKCHSHGHLDWPKTTGMLQLDASPGWSTSAKPCQTILTQKNLSSLASGDGLSVHLSSVAAGTTKGELTNANRKGTLLKQGRAPKRNLICRSLL